MAKKLKKLLAVTLVLSMTMSLLNLTSFAANDSSEALTVEVGSSIQLTSGGTESEEVVPTPGTPGWASDSDAATVVDGKVSGVKAGTAVITYTEYGYRAAYEMDGQTKYDYYDLDDPRIPGLNVECIKTVTSWTVTVTEPEPEFVAKIGDVEYATLDEAVAAAVDGDTIELLADCSSDGIHVYAKTLNIQGNNYTIRFPKKGIAILQSGSIPGILNIEDCVLDMTDTKDNPEQGGEVILVNFSCTLKLDNVNMNLTAADDYNGHGIFLHGGGILNITNGSNVTVADFNGSGASGIYCEPDDVSRVTPSKIEIVNSNLTVTGCSFGGMTVNRVDTLMDNADVYIAENGVNGGRGGYNSYYGTLKVTNGTHFTVENNVGGSWGAFVNDVTIENYSIVDVVNNNGGNGLVIGSTGIIDGTSTVNILENTGRGLRTYPHTEDEGEVVWHGDCTIADGANVMIKGNKNGGIKNDCTLVMNAGTVIQNSSKDNGGGILNKTGATASIADSVNLYNNHAETAGDDIYNKDGASITFGQVGSDWVLDGEPAHCTDLIDGWYIDGYHVSGVDDNGDPIIDETRWNAHTEPFYIMEEPGQTTESELALKAAHGIYKVTYHPNFDSKTETDVHNEYAGDDHTVLSYGETGLPSRNGYAFIGWNTAADNSGTAYAPDAVFTMPRHDVDLYAQWEKADTTYTIQHEYYTHTDGNPDNATLDATWVDGLNAGKYGETVTAVVRDTDQGNRYAFDADRSDALTITLDVDSANNVITLRYYRTSYQVVHEYYTDDNTEPDGTVTIDPVADEIGKRIESESIEKLPEYNGKTYTFKADASTEQIVLEVNPAKNTIYLRYFYTTPSTPTPTPDYYKVTVNYYDKDTGEKIAASYVSDSIREGKSYDVTDKDAIAIEGYTYDSTSGDPLTGVMDSDKVINVYYVAEVEELPEPEPPLEEKPEEPEEIPDPDVPLVDVPETGDLSLLWLLAALASGLGLVALTILEKKRKNA